MKEVSWRALDPCLIKTGAYVPAEASLALACIHIPSVSQSSTGGERLEGGMKQPLETLLPSVWLLKLASSPLPCDPLFTFQTDVTVPLLMEQQQWHMQQVLLPPSGTWEAGALYTLSSGQRQTVANVP